MNSQLEETQEHSKLKPLRIWPAVLLLALMAAAKSIPLFIQDESMAVLMASILGPLLAGTMIILWWITLSRASSKEKMLGFLGMILCVAVVFYTIDPTMQGPGLILLGGPLGTAAFGITAVLLGRWRTMKRTVLALLAALIGFGFVTLLKNDGMWGDGHMGLTWRWEPFPEEAMLASRSNSIVGSEELSGDQIDQWLESPEWPKFRGSNGDSKQTGSVFSDDWTKSPPKLIWETPVGPGWSSFVVAGNLLFTQEQLGEEEAVVCYAADTGKELWKQQINERFFDPLGGPGPRATPTLSNSMLFVQSAMGELQRLDPKTGKVVWAKDLKEVAERDPPAWGFSSSPLVVDDLVIVHAGGADDKGTLAFAVESGALKWSAKSGNHSYSSPTVAEIDGKNVVLVLSNDGLSILDPKTGAELLDYEWPHAGYRATQPQVVDGHSILIPTQELGTRRIKLETVSASADSTGGYKATEEWTSRQLKPDFNDFVIHDDSAYGFDGRFFTCIDVKTGKRNWKGGRYGKGQVLLLADSRLLLVISESGDLVLLKAASDSRQELAKIKAIEGRTWNHPVVIGNRLYVRNSQIAACYELPLAAPTE